MSKIRNILAPFEKKEAVDIAVGAKDHGGKRHYHPAWYQYHEVVNCGEKIRVYDSRLAQRQGGKWFFFSEQIWKLPTRSYGCIQECCVVLKETRTRGILGRTRFYMLTGHGDTKQIICQSIKSTTTSFLRNENFACWWELSLSSIPHKPRSRAKYKVIGK